MNKSFILVFIIATISIISCQNRQEKIQEQNPTERPEQDSINLQTIRSLGEVLSPESKLKVANWTAYNEMDRLVDDYYAMSAKEVLMSADELKYSTMILKDSITDDRFKEIGIRTRINVMHNSALRLADMAKILNISAVEVNEETQKMLNAFSSLNAKLNNITSQELIQAQVSEIEKDFPKKN